MSDLIKCQLDKELWLPVLTAHRPGTGGLSYANYSRLGDTLGEAVDFVADTANVIGQSIASGQTSFNLTYKEVVALRFTIPFGDKDVDACYASLEHAKCPDEE